MSHQRSHLFGFLMITVSLTFVTCWVPCSELSPAIRIPCKCELEGDLPTISIECDQIVFTSDIPGIPLHAPVSTFIQRNAGLSAIPVHILSASLPITKLDFSHNFIKSFPPKIFNNVKDTLTELNLNGNILGDSLNPIFSTVEFSNLENLTSLDLSNNKIKSIEEGIFKGSFNLQELYVDGNNLLEVPTNSLNGPSALRIISLKQNQISNIKSHAFAAQTNLERIDLRKNKIMSVDSDAFAGLKKVKEIYLGHNQLSRFNSDVFEGIETLQKLDLSENYFSTFPSIALKEIELLKVLNLSSNMIKSIESTHLHGMKSLQILDLSRNAIVVIEPGTFREQKNLRFLDLSLNSLRTIEDDAFEELDSLQTLIIRDNNVLLVPSSALGRLPKLTNLYLDYNRVAALSSDILGPINAADIRYMSLSRNVIRELPGGSFKLFKNLVYLDLLGNSLTEINAEMFEGLEKSLMELKLGQNKITTITNSLNLNQLRRLDLSNNNIVEVNKNVFEGVTNLLFLNFSHNHHLAPVPSNLLRPLTKLQYVDLSNIGLRNFNPDFFATNTNLRTVILTKNKITELTEASFKNLRNLTVIDLSFNMIMTMKPGAFINTMSMKTLLLKGNQLNAFKGEIFNTGTGLEEIDLSENQISYIFQTSFKIHPRLRKLNLSNNKFNFFPAATISGLQFLENIDLSFNQLKTVEELDFARLPRLREINLKGNQLEMLSEMAFHNSTQLQILDLSHNKLDRIGERTLEGFTRVQKLDLGHNLLSELPEGLLERSRVKMLEHVILSDNNFINAPLKSLQKRNIVLHHLDLSRNKITEISHDDRILIDVKNLDLSFNPLSDDTVEKIFSVPKTARVLNLSGTGIKHIPLLETPFLQNLNLSSNNLVNLQEKVFERTPLLEVLDLSKNRLNNLHSLSKIWPFITSLNQLDLSENNFETIIQGDFNHLPVLRSLSVHTQPKCTRIEKNAFRNLTSLSTFEAYDYPILGYLDVQGILNELPTLEEFDIEMKDSSIGSDHIQPTSHPRLTTLGIRGYRLRTLSSGVFAGLKNRNLQIRLQNTSLTSLQPALFFPVPRSAIVHLDISGSMITALSSQFLSVLEDRRNSLTLSGLNSNPVNCDCNARALRRWLSNSHMTGIVCYSPDDLHGRLLIEVGDDELTCSPKKSPARPFTAAPLIEETPASTNVYTEYSKSAQSSAILTRATTEPDIIWSQPTNQPGKIKTKLPLVKQPLTNDDTLILGIVGAVVAFILILIVIICIVRLRMSSSSMTHISPSGIPTDPSVQLSYKTMPALYFPQQYAAAAQSYATLPHKMSMSSHASHHGGHVQSYANTLTHPHHQYQQDVYMHQQQEEKNYYR